MRLVFAGTPRTAVPSLEALLTGGRHQVVAVCTRPDAPSGRGRVMRASPVREVAEAAGLEVLTPRRPSEPAFLERLAALAPDCCPVVAYGALIPAAALAIPRHGWVNLHFSLLPAWRGATPVQHAILAGDEVTGATTFRLDEGMDTGEIFGTLTTEVGGRETAGELLDRLARDGAGLLAATLDGVADGTLHPRPQPSEGVSYAPKITPADARIDWRAPALAVDRRVRACTPAPGAWTLFREARLGLGPLDPAPGPADRPGGLRPGELVVADGAVRVGTGRGDVILGELRPPGKPSMPAIAWVRGARLAAGEALG